MNMFSKTKKWLRDHRWDLVQVGGILCMAFILPHIGFAADVSSEEMPWATGLTKIKDELTGPIPKYLSLISIAVTGVIWAIGDIGPVAKKAVQIVFGVSIALGAPSFMKLIGTGQGSLF